MTWQHFNWLAPAAVLFWLLAAWSAFYRPRRVDGLMIAGIAILAVFIAGFWLELGRPPMRTMGETRLWYSFFLSGAGYLAYRRWGYPWLLAFSCVMAGVFAGINLFKPEIHSIALMPALQSYFFVPHVTVYMLSYSILAVATLASLLQLRKIERGSAGGALRRPGHGDEQSARPGSDNSASSAHLYAFLDNLVHIGLGFLMLGLISGAAWAKEAWGHYWSWDPKETWAFITAAAYLLYIHLRLRPAVNPRLTLWILPLAFVLLMITWLGVALLPSAAGSVHIYS